MPKLERAVEINDDNSVTWIWDGEYLYVQGLLQEMAPGDLMSDIGYYCESLEEVFRILSEGGYINPPMSY